MKSKTGKATAKTAYGKAIEPFDYEYTFDAYENHDEVVAAKDELTAAEVVKVRNTERQNNARQAKLTAELTARNIVKPTLENDEQHRLKEMLKVLMSSKKYSEDEARELAATTLGLTWASEDSE
jgi:hypothetical protein